MHQGEPQNESKCYIPCLTAKRFKYNRFDFQLCGRFKWSGSYRNRLIGTKGAIKEFSISDPYLTLVLELIKAKSGKGLTLGLLQSA